MNVLISVQSMTEDTRRLAFLLNPVFDDLSSRLSGDYGGVINHLWISLELVNWDPCATGPRFPFRVQKRVSGGSRLGLPAGPDKFNVAHFSVRPDFGRLATLFGKRAIDYVLSVIYRETEVLLTKRMRTGGLDAEKFRSAYRSACEDLGYRWSYEPRTSKRDGAAQSRAPSTWGSVPNL